MSLLLYRYPSSWAPAGFFLHGKANGEPRPEGPKRGVVLGEEAASPLPPARESGGAL